MKKEILLTLILNSIIIISIPSAHAGGIMIMFEFLCIPEILKYGIEFKKEYMFESSILLIVLVSLIGKVIVIFSLFSEKILERKNLIYFGLILMLITFFIVLIGIWKFDTLIIAITFGTGIPFLIYSGKIMYLMNKEIS
ncbi:MAG: hypothetical protein COZ16_05980 [Flavobacteriaceae bacterium CG_4_10_14_3_um_filter_31_253]|nr:MAG: hypothetical protein COZ74_01770 [Flavobacteriaceae bacterium CG_4_8_14_3_um_filter_31_8]PIY15058.1 MAG: hypothetical protein COZ16_05980 [Flavobacteriaceae bacterium CG_4_10_14_3_um_filter_31_253]PIZ12399.1 MAG: hypothetical protein COY55_00050 [Flavobacteriaceae bacterium CG_4_10_14_0_8_um_filter_31_99]PJC10079.1 MAG: hypothetical protein CO067_06540 [Flavobacteriaceae bacterium CG_4_9_14_0_8_um_filter_31_91]